MEAASITRVVILTAHYRIVGNIDLLPGARMTDYIAESKTFFAVTDAEVWDLNGRKITTTSFMNVNRDHVEIIMPENAVKPSAGVALA